jgi:hypothetical protein
LLAQITLQQGNTAFLAAGVKKIRNTGNSQQQGEGFHIGKLLVEAGERGIFGDFKF